MSTPHYRDSAIELHVGDALTVLAQLPEHSVDSVVTSPPQWGLRDYETATWSGGDPRCQHTLGTTPHQRRTVKKYGTTRGGMARQKRCRKCGARCCDQQYGLEPSLDEYVQRIREVGHAIGRVLRPSGTFWLNLRDSYSYYTNGTGIDRNPDSADSEQPYAGLVRHKSLFGIPWRVALRLQDEGWIIRNAIVWHKPNSIPDPARDRLSSCYEMLFLLVKHPDYAFTSDAVHTPSSSRRSTRRKTHHGGNKSHTITTPWTPETGGTNLGDVWSVPTRPLAEPHPAPFPVDLPRRCIAAGSPEAGRVLDPFSGAGTTGLAACQLGRQYLGIDLRADYHDLFLRRLANTANSGQGDGAV